MTRQTAKGQAQHRAQLLPTKDTLKALKSDVTLESACLELCDNSLDAWKRNNNHTSSACIEIRAEEKDDRTELVIRDNTGGVPKHEAAMLFGLGQTAKSDTGGSIGTFGVGAKKSLVNLGIPFQIRSCHFDSSRGWNYEINEEWFEKDDDWSVPVNVDPQIEQGTTEIRIKDLNYQWDEETKQSLREALGKAYNCFLSEPFQKLRKDFYDLEITVDGELIEPEGIPDWSYSPFDGLAPRRYEEIEVHHPDSDHPINVAITVGLLRKKTSTKAGTDIYCQKRKIASSLRNDVGGFSTGQNGIGKFMARHERLKAIVEIETEGNGQLLPWDTQKSSIDRHNPIMRGTDSSRGIYNWLRRTVSPYYELDADAVPRAFVEAYGRDRKHAANGGCPYIHNYSDRQRITSKHRPNTDLSELQEVHNIAIAHAALRVRSENDIKSWQQPAYRLQLQTECEKEISNLTEIDTQLPSAVISEPFESVGRIKALAMRHINAGVIYTGELEEWEQPIYKRYIEANSDGSLDEVGYRDDLPGTSTDLPAKGSGTDVSQPTISQASQIASSKKSVSSEQANASAELFLVLDRDTDNERIARLSKTKRKELCRRLGLSGDASDDVLWEAAKDRIDSALE